MDDIGEFLTIYIGKHISIVFGPTYSLPHFINAYREGKSFDDHALDHILTLECINQSTHYILNVISDYEETLFDCITLEHLCISLYQYWCPTYDDAEWATYSLAFIKIDVTTIHITLIVMITCGSRQGSVLSYPSSNAGVSLKTRLAYTQHIFSAPHDWQLCSHVHRCDDFNKLSQLTLRVLSYCDDDTKYRIARTLVSFNLQVQISLDRDGDFSLVTKLGRKDQKHNVTIFNSDTIDTRPTSTSTTSSYDHEDLHTCQVETHLQSLDHYEFADNIHESIPSSSLDKKHKKHEFTSEQATATPTKLFVITTTLTVNITQSAASSLRKAHLCLQQTTRQKYTVITIQRLFTALVHSVYWYNPLCNPIVIPKCLSFDKWVHVTYCKVKKEQSRNRQILLFRLPTSWPSHTFPSRQLAEKSCARIRCMV